jgi:rfaE bifunctional protein kinase chain/domain
MDYSRYQKIISKFKDKNIIIVGDIMLDVYYWGDVHRISQEAPVPVVNITNENVRAGGAGNVATNLFGLNSTPYLIGVLGEDENGNTLLKELKDKVISTAGIVQVKDRSTIVKTRVIAQNQQMIRFDKESTSFVPKSVEEKVINNLKNYINKAHGIILSDYGKGILTPTVISEIIRISKQRKIPVYVDPKTNDFSSFKAVHMIKPNLFEFQSVVGEWNSKKEFDMLGQNLREKLDVDILLVTLGAEGSNLFTKEQQHKIPTKALHVHDVSGAGDTVISTFALSELSGANAEESAFMANYAAGIVCEEVGVIPIILDNLTKVVKNYLT